jgi:hypothetical protein
MKHKLFALVSLLVVFSMIVPVGGMAAGGEEQEDSSTLYQISLPIVQKPFEYLHG